MKDQFYNQSFPVNFEYPVVFTHHVFDISNPILTNILARDEKHPSRRAVVYVDSGVAAHHSTLDRRITSYFSENVKNIELALPPQILPGGETIKNDLSSAEKILTQFIEVELCRHSLVIVVGGGAILDAVGFAASLFHRGLRLVRLPTTVLAQNDVGVGVKNAINFAGGKNTIGTFSPPWAVINDFAFLPTLTDQHWINGIAEAFKVAIIGDSAFFDFLCGHAELLRARDQCIMEQLIMRCAELHLKHIRTSGDPFEFGCARPLDFGHWAAHKLETLSKYRIGHGEAVATGIALDSCYAHEKGWIAEEEFTAIYNGLRTSGFTLWADELEIRDSDETREIFRGLEDFRRHLGGMLYVTFPEGIGKKKEVNEIDIPLMSTCIEKLKRLT